MIDETTIQEPTKEFSPDEDSIFTIWLDSQDDEPVTPETIISVASRFDKAPEQLNADQELNADKRCPAPLVRFGPDRL